MTVLPTPWMRLLRAPFSEVALSPLDGAVYRWTPMRHHLKATRLVLPTDYANGKLRKWNQKTLGAAEAGNNPWYSDGSFWFTSAYYIFGVAFILLNSGTSVWLRDIAYNNPQSVGMDARRTNSHNFVHTKASDTFKTEFYLDNDLEETNPMVLYDDSESFWTTWHDGSGSYDITLAEETTEKVKGASSLKVIIGAGSYDEVNFLHNFSPHQDWSNKDFLCIYLYGENSGEWINLYIIAPNWLNFKQFIIIDNFSGWKRIILPFNNPTSETGSPDMSDIATIQFSVWPTATHTWYVDRLLVDVGQWVKIEAYVPDSLVFADNKYFILRTWDGSTWKGLIYPDYTSGRIHIWSPNGYFLDGSQFSVVYNGNRKGGAGYKIGERGDTRSIEGAEQDSDAGDMIYSAYYGCLKRVGFALKLPPDDGQDSSTAGISQCKLKLEVYYADSGRTTYEFENSGDYYYGLQNMNESWLAAFDPTTRRVEYLILSKRPTGMTVCVDENELIDRVDLTLAKGTRVFAGDLVWGSLTRDSDGDDVPDFLSGGSPTVEVAPTEIYDDDETFWSTWTYGSGSYDIVLSEEITEKQSGASSLKMDVQAGSKAWVGVEHNYGSPVDWSAKKFLCLYLYGTNAGDVMRIAIEAPDTSNYRRYQFTNNWSGWKRLVIPLEDYYEEGGSPNLSTVALIRVYTQPTGTKIHYLDRLILDVESPIGIPYLVSKLFQGGYP